MLTSPLMIATIIVHGGTGLVEEDRRVTCIKGCEKAAQIGFAVLVGGRSALDAVEAAVRVLEDDPEFNAGYGSVLNRDGVVEVDACITDGDLRIGAVGAVPWLRHPVTLARRILDRGEHAFLVAHGAVAFAREQGISCEGPETMIAPRAMMRHEHALRLQQVAEIGDTVGACAIDSHGRVAAATSTGGLNFKRPGRVGDSPIAGAGAYASSRVGAVSTTGHGESIMRMQMARSAADRLEATGSLEQAARGAVAELVERTRGEAGVILVDLAGRVGHYATRRMPWAAIVAGCPASGIDH